MISRRGLFTRLAGSSKAVVLGARESCAPPVQPAPPATRPAYFPNYVLTTHDGVRARFYDDLVSDKIVAINMMYARCTGACPAATANMLEVQRALGSRAGRDIFLYSITLDPEHDTADVLRTYASHHGVGPGWQFLTGKPAEIEVLRRRLGFAALDPQRDADRSNHTSVVRYGKGGVDAWGSCSVLGSPEQILRSILGMDEGPTDASGLTRSAERSPTLRI